MKKMFMLLITAAVSIASVSAQSFLPEKTQLEKAAKPNSDFEIKHQKTWIDGKWVNTSKSELVYNKNGHLKEEVIYKSDDGYNYSISEKIEFNIDNDGVVFGIKEYQHVNDDFELVRFVSYDYTNNRIFRVSTYENTTSGWNVVHEEEYNYNQKKKLMNIYSSDFNNGVKLNQFNYIYNYNNSDGKLNRIELKKHVNNDWKNVEYTDYEYNVNNQLTKATKFGLDGTVWEKNLVSTFTYSDAKAMTYQVEKISPSAREILNFWEFEYDNNDRLTALTKQDTRKGSLNNSERIEYMAQLPSSVFANETKTVEFTAYPNPVNNQLNLQFENNETELEYSLVALSGNIVKRGSISPLQASSSLTTSDLAPGMYVLTLATEKGIIKTNNIVVAH